MRVEPGAEIASLPDELIKYMAGRSRTRTMSPSAGIRPGHVENAGHAAMMAEIQDLLRRCGAGRHDYVRTNTPPRLDDASDRESTRQESCIMVTTLKTFIPTSSAGHMGQVQAQFELADELPSPVLVANITSSHSSGKRSSSFAPTMVATKSRGTSNRANLSRNPVARVVRRSGRSIGWRIDRLRGVSLPFQRRRPYRPHLPHPDFIRLIGYGDVELADNHPIERRRIHRGG